MLILFTKEVKHLLSTALLFPFFSSSIHSSRSSRLGLCIWDFCCNFTFLIFLKSSSPSHYPACFWESFFSWFFTFLSSNLLLSFTSGECMWEISSTPFSSPSTTSPSSLFLFISRPSFSMGKKSFQITLSYCKCLVKLNFTACMLIHFHSLHFTIIFSFILVKEEISIGKHQKEASMSKLDLCVLIDSLIEC